MFKKLLLVLALAFPVTASASVSLDTTDAIKNSNWRQAATLISRDLQDTPADAKAWYYKAQIANKLGDGPTTYNAIQTAKSIDPSLSFANDKRMFYALEAKSTPRQQQQPQQSQISNDTHSGKRSYTFLYVIFAIAVALVALWYVPEWYSRRKREVLNYVNGKSDALTEANDLLERTTRLHYKVQANGNDTLISQSTSMLSRGQALVTDVIDLEEKYSDASASKLESISRRLRSYKSDYYELESDLRKKESPPKDVVTRETTSAAKERRESRNEVLTDDYYEARERRQRNNSSSRRSNRSGNHEPSHNTTVVNNTSNSSGSDFITGMALGSMLSSSSSSHSTSSRHTEDDSGSSSGSMFDWGYSSSSSSDDSSSNRSFDWGSSSIDTSSSSGFDSGSIDTSSSGSFDF